MISITFTEEQRKILHDHLFPGDGKESLAICLAKQIKHNDGHKLIVTEVHLIPYSLCDRDEQYISWSSKDIIQFMDKAENEKLSLIKIHSHPYGPRAFSEQDNRSDNTFFPSVSDWCGNDNIHCSMIFTEDFILARGFQSGKFTNVEKIWVIGDRLKLFSAQSVGDIECAFDELTYKIFNTLKIAIIGCSGTGGWIIELLGRNQTGYLIPCDPDILDNPNLTRVLNSKLKDIGKNKALIAADVIRDMGYECKIEAITAPLQTRRTLESLKGCDAIFGCVDSIYPRHLLNIFCTYYMIPYFDIGVHIEASSTKLVSAAGGFHYIQPGKSSLLSRNLYSSKELADETYKTLNPSFYSRLEKEGYVRGRKASRPAVSGLNSLASVTCFNEFESLVLNYKFEDEKGIASKTICKKSGEEYSRFENEFAVDQILKKKMRLGDDFFEKEKTLFEEENVKTSNELEI